MWSNVVVHGAIAGVLVGTLIGCTTTDTRPSETVTTLVPDSERLFKVTWDTAPDGGAGVRLRGYVENAYGQAAAKVQLLAQAQDAPGRVTAQRIQWLPVVIPPFGRVYFEIASLPVAHHYRVSVWSYDRLRVATASSSRVSASAPAP